MSSRGCEGLALGRPGFTPAGRSRLLRGEHCRALAAHQAALVARQSGLRATRTDNALRPATGRIDHPNTPRAPTLGHPVVPGGHGHSTQKAIAERMKECDVVIELLNARLPSAPTRCWPNDGDAAASTAEQRDLADHGARSGLADFFARRATPASPGAAWARRRRRGADRRLPRAARRGGSALPRRAGAGVRGVPNVGGVDAHRRARAPTTSCAPRTAPA